MERAEQKRFSKQCKTCTWWLFGMCSQPSILAEHLKITGEDKTFVQRAQTDSCEYWILNPVLEHTETPGSRAKHHGRAAVPDTDLGLAKAGAAETIDASVRGKG
jgi:hypothetical protein